MPQLSCLWSWSGFGPDDVYSAHLSSNIVLPAFFQNVDFLYFILVVGCWYNIYLHSWFAAKSEWLKEHLKEFLTDMMLTDKVSRLSLLQ